MKSTSRKNVLSTALGCLVCFLALIFGAMFGGNVALASASEEALAPTVVSVGGIAIGSSKIGSFPAAIVNEEYKDADGKNYKIIATGSGKLTYSAREYETEVYGHMPKGLHLNPETGEFYGTITSAGTFGVSITVSNDYGSANVLCYISVYNASDKPTITTESLPNGAVGSVYSQTIEFSGYYADGVKCEVVSGTLPTGLNIGMIGVVRPKIYGTPTETGSFTFTLNLKNGAGIATKEYTIEITEETVRPYLIPSATIVNESDKYSSIEVNTGSNSLCLHVVKGKEVNVQLVSSGTNTADNPIKYELFGTNGVLPEGLTMSESGLITGTVSNDIETSGGKTQIDTYIMIGNKTVGGSPQSSSDFIYIVVHENGHVNDINLDPRTTSVAKGGTRQFEIVWEAYGDVDKTAITWSFAHDYMPPTSSQTTISDTGLLTVGIDETETTLYIRAEHASGKIGRATVTIVDYTHTTTLVEAKAKNCTEDGNIKHYKCTDCDELFEDALATKTLSADKVKIPASHEYGTLISKVPATCSSTGKEAYYKCSACHTLFTSAKVETTDDALVIAKDETAHKFGTWKNEVPANCATEGTKAHKTCEYCHKHFDNEGTEIADLTIAKNDNHSTQSTWTKDASGHWHACTRTGCKDGGKVDFAEHTKSATEATETSDVHCTVCEYVIEAKKGHVHNLKIVAGRSNACYTDGAKTYWVCSEGDNPCGKFFEDKDGTKEITENIDKWKVIPAGHNFGDWVNGTEPTCGSTGEVAHKTCSICKGNFDNDGKKLSTIVIEKNDKHLVTDTEKLESDQYGHWHVCTREGCKNNGKADYTEHTKSATEATEDNDIHCTVCGFIIEARKGHVHELSKVDGYAETCTADGAKTYWVCSEGEHPCGKYFEDAEGKTEITASRLNAWKTIPAAPHTFGDWVEEVPATVDEFGVKAHKDCSVCHKHFDADGNEIVNLQIDKLTAPDDSSSSDSSSSDSSSNDSSRSDSSSSATNENKKGTLSGGAIAGIAAGGVAVAGFGGFAVVWFVVKKKKWADLVAVFKNLFAKK